MRVSETLLSHWLSKEQTFSGQSHRAIQQNKTPGVGGVRLNQCCASESKTLMEQQASPALSTLFH
eukprot:m.161907 g.161907  ORF g.161907 m.161907 type:complete len:65 (-) comp14367_c7_seq1:55-249(-)